MDLSKSKALVIGAGLGGLTSAAKLAQTEDYDVMSTKGCLLPVGDLRSMITMDIKSQPVLYI